MKIIDRIFELIEFQGITIAEFERKNSLSNGYLGKMKRRSADVGEGIVVSILENCPEISPAWLVLGEGEMQRTRETTMPGTGDNTLLLHYIAEKDALIREQSEEIGRLKEQVRQLRQQQGVNASDAASS